MKFSFPPTIFSSIFVWIAKYSVEFTLGPNQHPPTQQRTNHLSILSGDGSALELFENCCQVKLAPCSCGGHSSFAGNRGKCCAKARVFSSFSNKCPLWHFLASLFPTLLWHWSQPPEPDGPGSDPPGAPARPRPMGRQQQREKENKR